MSYEWFISLRYLKAKRKQTFISLITWISIGGVAIGVCALIVVLAVMTGAQEDLKGKILGANSHILITRMGGGGFTEPDNVVNIAKKRNGVIAASPFIYKQVMLSSASNVTGVVLRGIEVDPVAKSTDLASYMIEGMLEHLQEKYARVLVAPDDLGVPVEQRRAGIVVGKELAGQLRVGMGDPLTVVSPVGNTTPGGMVPVSREYYISGIFSSGMYEYDASLALISLTQAQSLFKMGDKVTGVEVKIEDVYRSGEVSDVIREQLSYPFIVRDWRELNRNLFFALKLEKVALGVILALIVCVAAFNIVSTLIMVVMEKTKDIAILKAMGASPKSIMRIFFLEGMIIGCSGTALGVAGGVALGQLLKRYQFIKLPEDVYNLTTLPVLMQFSDVAIVSALALLVTVLATIYPAWSASRLDPAETLRYE